jgi:hypothetical protein
MQPKSQVFFWIYLVAFSPSLPCPSRWQRHRRYKHYRRTKREAAGTAQRGRSQTCPCRGFLRSGQCGQFT